MKISVFGTGYVGLVTAVCLAESGNEVIAVDIDENKINLLKEGIPPIYEKGLEELLKWNLKNNRLKFTTDPALAVESSHIIFIAVGTPSNPDGSCNLTYVFDCVNTIKKYANNEKIIVIKSTVPVGTANKAKEIVKDSKHKIYVCSNPEFLKEGVAIEDFMKPDRVVIGADNDYVFEVMRELYAPFVRNEKPIISMDNESAEMTKYAANALLAVKISFMNEIALLCEKVNADVEMVRKGVGADYRIGYQFLFPGVGFGGSCFPKDVRALIHLAEENDFDLMIPKSAYNVNERQKRHLLNKIFDFFGEDLSDKTFGIWGLSFKPNTDDMREAPSIVIINGLLSAGAKVRAFDPKAMEEAKKIFGEKIYYAESDYDALSGADAMILITEWQEFRNPDFDKIKKLLKRPVIFDGRNQYSPRKMKELGFKYYGIGRKNV
ncbi:MAG: UDP-glucose/GDP-mannose dehydrogenase family protein [Proteobacteria bacterium]|nr:UDP-glucose/GDP-mannose dehydrogenase family protein [Pseudomonadota bacterium]